MKKIFYLFISLILLINFFACAGYESVLQSSNIEFKIVDHSITGDKKIGRIIYDQLNNLSKLHNNAEAKDLDISINVTENESATSKNTAGKILGYKINLSTSVVVKDFKTNAVILNEKFDYSLSYEAQDQHFETLKLKNKIIENLTNKINQELLLKLSEKLQ